MSEWIILGVIVGGTELLLRITDYLRTRKTRSLGITKKNQKHHQKVKTNREKTERNRA